jgi:hypothetical protein
MKKKSAQKAPQRVGAPLQLTAEERMLVALYRTVSGSTQRVIRFMLFQEWTNPLPHEADEGNRRFSAQIHSPLLAGLDVSAFDTFSNSGGAR